jgi:GTP-binding protein
MRFKTVEHYNEYQIPVGSPMSALPQVAIVGRSNSGKSTLLNALVEQRHAARTSAMPGRTQEIHFFLLDEALMLADLPGYGYAAVSKKLRKDWDVRMARYLTTLPRLRLVLLIQDCRRDPGPEEQWILDRAREQGAEFLVLANKIDQLPKPQIKLRLADLFSMYRAIGHPGRIVGLSARDKQGLEPVEERLTRLV